MAEAECDASGDVGLAPLAGPELHRRRRVEDEPRDEHALRELHADVRLAGAGRDVPLHQADVVARHVRTHLRELRPGPVMGGAEVAGEHARQAARDVELERAEELGRQGPRSRPLGRSLPEQRRRFHAAGGRASSTSGAGTSASTRSRIASAVTPSASA